MKELNVAIKAAKESGKVLMKYYRKGFVVERKSDASPVTIADKESEKKIVSVIRKHFPDHNFLAEEFSYPKTDSDSKWIIDPLDMTKNFVHSIQFFNNFIALEKNGKVIVGVIYMPALKILAYASKGKGAFVNGKRVRVSKTDRIEKSFVVFGDVDGPEKKGYGKQFFDLLRKCENHRGYGDALGYILLAQGSVDIAVDMPKPWDIAAAKIIVEEAGGRVTDFEGKNTIYSGHAVGTNGKLHEEVIKIFR